MLQVAAGSKNPIKVGAIRSGFASYWPELETIVNGFDIESGVSAQPMSDEESRKGAKNRAKKALETMQDAAYGVGIEGGLQEIDGVWTDSQWVVVMNRAGKVGIGQSVRVEVPGSMVELIKQGLELGDVIDRIFQKSNMKHAGGYINEVTQQIIDREQQCYGAVIVALAPFASPDLFDV